MVKNRLKCSGSQTFQTHGLLGGKFSLGSRTTKAKFSIYPAKCQSHKNFKKFRFIHPNFPMTFLGDYTKEICFSVTEIFFSQISNIFLLAYFSLKSGIC